MAGDDDDNTPVSKAAFDEAIDKMIKMIGDIGKKVNTEVSSVLQDYALLSTSIKNVQTQLLEKQGRFDSGSYSGGDKAPAPPVHKLRFLKYDGYEDPHHLDPQGRAVFSCARHARGPEGVDDHVLPPRRSKPVVLPLGEESRRP